MGPLIKNFSKKFIADMYFPLPVPGVTPLHIAVVNQNLNLVQHLINRGGDVATPRVTGLYFRKRIGGLIYYGKQA